MYNIAPSQLGLVLNQACAARSRSILYILICFLSSPKAKRLKVIKSSCVERMNSTNPEKLKRKNCYNLQLARCTRNVKKKENVILQTNGIIYNSHCHFRRRKTDQSTVPRHSWLDNLTLIQVDAWLPLASSGNESILTLIRYR